MFDDCANIFLVVDSNQPTNQARPQQIIGYTTFGLLLWNKVNTKMCLLKAKVFAGLHGKYIAEII